MNFIADDTFRLALDKALKAQGITKKKDRNERIGDCLLLPLARRDAILDEEEGKASAYQQSKREDKVCPSENHEQIETVNWWRHTYPQHKIVCVWNGGSRTPRERAEQKLLGLEPGVSDLHIPALDIWLEMKRHDPKLCNWSDEQKEWKRYVESEGETYILAYGFEDAKRQLIKVIDNCNLLDK
jgi:hypothetical protein